MALDEKHDILITSWNSSFNWSFKVFYVTQDLIAITCTKTLSANRPGVILVSHPFRQASKFRADPHQLSKLNFTLNIVLSKFQGFCIVFFILFIPQLEGTCCYSDNDLMNKSSQLYILCECVGWHIKSGESYIC